MNLGEITAEAFIALQDADRALVGTDHYAGLAPFWCHEFRHMLRDASPAKLRRVHAAWRNAGLVLAECTEQHRKLAGQILEKAAR